MKWKGWEKTLLQVTDPTGVSGTREVQAITPVIVSASRSTDIPAFYGNWFLAGLNAGYVRWKSPFGVNPVYVSFEKTRVFAFWSKNPEPFLPCLDTLDHRRFGYYFLFTLNDYDAERLEPHVPCIDKRIDTFIRLSRRIGKGRVVWRFDPLVLSDRISVSVLLQKIQEVGDPVAPYTRRLVISFVDIEKYGKVQRNLRAGGFSDIREFTDAEVAEFCNGLSALNQRWGLPITACGEKRDLSAYGIGRGQRISPDLLIQEFGKDRELMKFLHPEEQKILEGFEGVSDPFRHLKDPGQRNTCRSSQKISGSTPPACSCVRTAMRTHQRPLPAGITRVPVRIVTAGYSVTRSRSKTMQFSGTISHISNGAPCHGENGPVLKSPADYVIRSG